MLPKAGPKSVRAQYYVLPVSIAMLMMAVNQPSPLTLPQYTRSCRPRVLLVTISREVPLHS